MTNRGKATFITPEQVAWIRYFRAKNMGYGTIAKQVGVSYNIARNVCRGNCWKKVP
jgi:hypothetical protein